MMEISQGRVNQLYGQFQKAGEAGLVVKKATEAPPKLTIEQRALLPDLLLTGAEYDGFEGEVWTSTRVGEVIKPHLGVSYEVSTMGLLLKELGLTRKPPGRRDYRQNPQRVEQWQAESLPELKKPAKTEKRLVLEVDDSAVNLLPQLRWTWTPVGQNPLLIEGCQSAPLSVRRAIRHQGDIYYQLQESNYTGTEIAQFLGDLCQFTQRKLLIIWDGASIPRSQEVKDWWRTEKVDGRVQLARLSADSPPLNATEPVWAWLKGGELQNLCRKTLDELTQQVQTAFEKHIEQTELIRNFFAPPKVAFYEKLILVSIIHPTRRV